MKNIFLKLITALLILPFACNPKEEIAPENPCGKYIEPNADFIMEFSSGEVENDEYLFYINLTKKKILLY